MRYALIYGLLAGCVVAAVIVSAVVIGPDNGIFHTLWFGYLVMFVAMTFIFVGVRRYRDLERGGVVRFLPAFGMGLAIALVATIAYVLIWEIYLASTHYAFIDTYFRGNSPEVVEMRESYRNPVVRAGYTFLELFPVGFIVALFSAALLRNPRLFPARAGRTEP